MFKMIGLAIRNSLRSNDITGRYGDDESTVLCTARRRGGIFGRHAYLRENCSDTHSRISSSCTSVRVSALRQPMKVLAPVDRVDKAAEQCALQCQGGGRDRVMDATQQPERQHSPSTMPMRPESTQISPASAEQEAWTAAWSGPLRAGRWSQCVCNWHPALSWAWFPASPPWRRQISRTSARPIPRPSNSASAMHTLKDAKAACLTPRLLETGSVVGHGDEAAPAHQRCHIDLNARQQPDPRELDGIGESCVQACSSRRGSAWQHGGDGGQTPLYASALRALPADAGADCSARASKVHCRLRLRHMALSPIQLQQAVEHGRHALGGLIHGLEEAALPPGLRHRAGGLQQLGNPRIESQQMAAGDARKSCRTAYILLLGRAQGGQFDDSRPSSSASASSRD